MSGVSKSGRSSAGGKKGTSSEPSREFAAVTVLFGAERAERVPVAQRSRLDKVFQGLVKGSLTPDQREVIVPRFNLSGELSAPLSDHRQIAAMLGRTPTAANWSLVSAENKLRKCLQEEFPELRQAPRTPQNS